MRGLPESLGRLEGCMLVVAGAFFSLSKRYVQEGEVKLCEIIISFDSVCDSF